MTKDSNAKASDTRYIRCEERIQKALLRLLASKSLTDIGVSELSREANVSRATFYSHYDNVGDVFDQLVQQALSDVQTFEERFSCEGKSCRNSNQSDRVTYCEQIRSKGEWSSVTKDPRFFHSMLSLMKSTEPLSYDSANLGIPRHASEALRLFQMSGCHAVATSKFAQQEDWPMIRELIDAFIEGGLNAIRARKNKMLD